VYILFKTKSRPNVFTGKEKLRSFMATERSSAFKQQFVYDYRLFTHDLKYKPLPCESF